VPLLGVSQYCAFTAASMTGFATFGVLSYHLQVRHVLPQALIPVTYSVAMAAAALAALGSGRLPRVGGNATMLWSANVRGAPSMPARAQNGSASSIASAA
jgi:hypothetical protein